MHLEGHHIFNLLTESPQIELVLVKREFSVLESVSIECVIDNTLKVNSTVVSDMTVPLHLSVLRNQ